MKTHLLKLAETDVFKITIHCRIDENADETFIVREWRKEFTTEDKAEIVICEGYAEALSICFNLLVAWIQATNQFIDFNYTKKGEVFGKIERGFFHNGL